MIPFNQTKIVCTVGPASEKRARMKQLILAGMDVMRLNFSHSNHAEHKRRLDTLKDLNDELGTHVASLLDTRGPEVRTHCFKNGKTTIRSGSLVTIHMEEIEGGPDAFSVTYASLYKDLSIGCDIIVDDGYLTMEVTAIDEEKKTITARANNTHTIKDRRGMNFPGCQLKLEFISSKDEDDIRWGVKEGVDFVAASFVRRREDVESVKRVLTEAGGADIPVIAKIECQEGVENLDAITDVADGVMIARGDLGVEVPPEEVPIIQKQIIRTCHSKGKISITATQMLESMQENQRPTRAEVSDVANAVLDGADAIMLSGESAIGKYPVESVDTMVRIGKRLEREIQRDEFIARASRHCTGTIADNIALSVAHAVHQGQVDLVVAPTVSGNTARLLSRFRPNTMVLALVPTAKLARKLALHSCLQPVPFSLPQDTETLIEMALGYILKNGFAKPGDRIVVTGGFPIGTPTNSFRIVELT